MMVKYKAEWKDVRAVFWLALTVGFILGALVTSAVQR
jgi:hypothetical protein